MKKFKHMRIDAILNENFQTADILYDSGIIYNRYSPFSLLEACEKNGLDCELIEKQLNHAEQFIYKNKTKLNDIPLKRLIDLIKDEYHIFFYKNASICEVLLANIVKENGDKFPEILKIYDMFTDLKEELIIHMSDEEDILFPLMVKRLDGEDAIVVQEEMEHDHEEILVKMARLRAFIKENAVKSDLNDIDNAFKLLRSIDKNLEEHVFLENHVLFKSFRLQTNLERNN